MSSTSSERARDLLEEYNDLLARAGHSLLEAVKAGDIGECRELLAIEGVDIHIKDSEGYPNYGMTPGQWACSKGYLDILEYLVSKGANINDKSDIGWSCLMWASYKGHLNIAEYLVSKGANIHDKSMYGSNCLTVACANNRLNVAEFLLSKGANIHEMNIYGDTCFSLARSAPRAGPHLHHRLRVRHRSAPVPR